MSLEHILARIVELIRDDVELHTAIVMWLQADAEQKQALAEWRRNRKKR